MKRIILIIFAFLFSFCSVSAEGYYIENYYIKIGVNKDKTLNVNENIDVFFTSPMHEIYKNIPFDQNSKISQISVSEMYQSTSSTNNIRLTIENPKNHSSGKHNYKIKYKYIYRDNENGLYYNLIGKGWSAPIKKVYFDIEMPKKFDISNVKIFRKQDENKIAEASFRSDGKNIKGALRDLKPFETIAVQVNVPRGYFGKYIDFAALFVSFIMIILTCMSVYMWNEVGKDKINVPIVTFPPKDVDLLEMEAIYRGKATTKGFTSVLFDLTRRDYIEIDYSNPSNWLLTCTKELDDSLKEYEKKFLRTLFCKYAGPLLGCTKFKNQLVKSKDFFADCNSILNEENEKYREMIFYRNSVNGKNQKKIFMNMTGIYFLTAFACIGFNVHLFVGLLIMLITMYVPAMLVVAFVSVKYGAFADKIDNAVKRRDGSIGFIIYVIIISLMACALLHPIVTDNLTNIYMFVFGVICFVISWVCLHNLPKRSRTGQKLLNEILGLKKFIEVAEKHSLETLCKNDPEYFYKILPYAYIFGLSNKWFKKFDKVISASVSWSDDRRTRKSQVFNIFSNPIYSILEAIRFN